jgi:hypothetical protein
VITIGGKMVFQINPTQGLIVLSFVAFCIELLTFILNRYFVSPVETLEEKKIAHEAKRLRMEEKLLDNSPATFMQFAKVGREATGLETKLAQIKQERENRKNTKAGQLAQQILKYMMPIPLIFSYFFWTKVVSEVDPVIQIPEAAWIWPVAHVLALPNQPPNGSVSSVGWMFLSRRVFARLIELVAG